MASRVATAARKYTTAVGTTTAVHTHTRSCVAASTGISRKPVVNTSDVQLCGVATPVSRVSTPSTTTSTSSASHAIRTGRRVPAAGPQRHRERPQRVAARDRGADADEARGRHGDHRQRDEPDEHPAQRHLQRHPAPGVLHRDRGDLRRLGDMAGFPKPRMREARRRP